MSLPDDSKDVDRESAVRFPISLPAPFRFSPVKRSRRVHSRNGFFRAEKRVAGYREDYVIFDTRGALDYEPLDVPFSRGVGAGRCRW